MSCEHAVWTSVSQHFNKRRHVNPSRQSQLLCAHIHINVASGSNHVFWGQLWPQTARFRLACDVFWELDFWSITHLPQGDPGLPGQPGAPGKEGKRVSKPKQVAACVGWIHVAYVFVWPTRQRVTRRQLEREKDRRPLCGPGLMGMTLNIQP